jgi:hypothetical protein
MLVLSFLAASQHRSQGAGRNGIANYEDYVHFTVRLTEESDIPGTVQIGHFASSIEP